VTGNPILSGLQAYSMVNNIERQNRLDDIAEQDHQREVDWQGEQRQNYRDDRSYQLSERQRIADARSTKANIYQMEQQLRQLQDGVAGDIGLPAAEYINPAKRRQDKSLITQAHQRMQAGKMDDKFFLNYLNSIHASQINKGAGGTNKRIVGAYPIPGANGEFAFELEYTGKDGKVVKAPMTANRGTEDEGDNEVKKVSIDQLLDDSLRREIIIDSFDKNGVGEGNDYSDNAKRLQTAIADAKAKLIQLGDTSIADRDLANMAAAQKRRQAIDLENLKARNNTNQAIAVEKFKKNNQHDSYMPNGNGKGSGQAKFKNWDTVAKIHYSSPQVDSYGYPTGALDYDRNGMQQLEKFMREYNIEDAMIGHQLLTEQNQAREEALVSITNEVGNLPDGQATIKLQQLSPAMRREIIRRLPKEKAESLAAVADARRKPVKKSSSNGHDKDKPALPLSSNKNTEQRYSQMATDYAGISSPL